MESDSDEELSSDNQSGSEEESGSDDQLPEELRDISFGELEEIRMKIGSKKFDAVVQKQQQMQQQRVAGAEQERKIFTRTNKNRPVEKSSKKAVSAGKRAIQPDKWRKKLRDPRFDDLSGNYNPDLYKKSYGFIDSVRAQEKKELQQEGKRTKDPQRKEDIIKALARMEQQEAKVRHHEEKQAAKRETRKQQNELLKQGKKPFYLKKADQRKLEIASKYAELKKSKQLDTFMEKKRKRNASRDRRRLPGRRDEE